MKRLIVCCDGTWQKLDNPAPTNVVKIAQAIASTDRQGIPQIVYYGRGLGTDNWYNKLIGGAFGDGLKEAIQDAYHFLCFNYVPGDEVYLFGFSRGAYTVRSLAGLIYCSGLLSRSYIRKAPEAYRIYRDPDIKPRDPQAVNFRQEYGNHVPITLLCCWDTVGALGIPERFSVPLVDRLVNQKYRFHDTSLSRIIEHALHAVAVDEQRQIFDVTPMLKSHNSDTQILRQVWFPGDHGGVGGGDGRQRGLSDGSLQWVVQTIGELGLGLEFDLDRMLPTIRVNSLVDFVPQSQAMLFLAGKYLREVTGNPEDLHESIKTRWRDRPDYRPPNLEIYRDWLDASPPVPFAEGEEQSP